MADNVTTQSATLATIPASTTVATDDVSGVHYQKVKLVDGTADSTTAAIVNSSGQLAVDPHPASEVIPVASAGLSTATTYASGDQVGTIFTFASATRSSGGRATLLCVDMLDKAKVLGDCELWLFNTNPTLASDNSAATFSDSDCASGKWITTVSFSSSTDRFDGGANYVFSREVSRVLETSASTSIYGALVTRTANAPFGAAGDVVVSLALLQD